MPSPIDIKITVGITTYNRPEYLKQSVLSVLNQSFTNFELIISNDYIHVPITAEQLGIDNDERVKIFNQKQNLGEVRNMNFLLEISEHEWFVWLADDDLMHPEFLLQANRCISKNKENNIVAFYSSYCSANKPDGIFPAELKQNKFSLHRTSDFIGLYTSKDITLIGCYGVMNVDVLNRMGGYPLLGNSFSPYSDTLIPLLLSEYGSIGVQTEPLMFLRTHADSLSCKSSEFSAYSSAEVDFLKRLKQVCKNKAVNVSADKIVASMVRWFACDEWAVLSRILSVSKIQTIMFFIRYQLKVNLGRLSFKYKIFHIVYLVEFFAKLILYRAYHQTQLFMRVN